jgi:hypothetical protein
MKAKQWLIQYVFCVRLLQVWGERAWPWNIPFVWRYVGREIMGKGK